jgi:pyridoxamine 5'-phosphate oxidase
VDRRLNQNPLELPGLSEQYDTPGIDLDDLGPDPIAHVSTWLEDAIAAGVPQANAMAVATVGPNGAPSLRTVLLKDVVEEGIVFFTNYRSRKGLELHARPRAAASLTWVQLHRQVRIEGRVTPTSAETSDAYFATRPRGAQIAATASPQSEEIPDRSWLEDRVAQLEAEYEGVDVPRPYAWGGFLVIPDRVEFWVGRRNRLHDRILFVDRAGRWEKSRLAP